MVTDFFFFSFTPVLAPPHIMHLIVISAKNRIVSGWCSSSAVRLPWRQSSVVVVTQWCLILFRLHFLSRTLQKWLSHSFYFSTNTHSLSLFFSRCCWCPVFEVFGHAASELSCKHTHTYVCTYKTRSCLFQCARAHMWIKKV